MSLIKRHDIQKEFKPTEIEKQQTRKKIKGNGHTAIHKGGNKNS